MCVLWKRGLGLRDLCVCVNEHERKCPMFMNAMVLDASVNALALYDQMTGVQKPGYSVRLTVLDADTSEKYEVQVNDGLPLLDHLKELKKQGQPADVLQQVAAQLETQLPVRLTQLQLEVRRIKVSKGFMTLICRLAGVAAAA